MKMFLTCVVAVVLLASCGPYKKELVEEIENHETAFVIPIEYGTAENQAKLMSEEYLDKMKIASKRVILGQRKQQLGRLWFNYRYIPTERVVKVDRTPVTKDWTTVKEKDGKVVQDKGFPLASQDSVGFTVGINLTCMIEEKDAARYLYHFRAKSLSETVDDVVRGFVQNALSDEIGTRKLTECQLSKVEIMRKVQERVEKQLAEYGIRLVTIGLADEFLYDNERVQEAIDMVYVNESKVRQAQQAQEEAAILNKTALDKAKNENEINLAKARNDREIAEIYESIVETEKKRADIQCRVMEAKAMADAAGRWNGVTPANILPQGASMIYPFNVTREK